jgi:hypothetical protein
MFFPRDLSRPSARRLRQNIIASSLAMKKKFTQQEDNYLLHLVHLHGPRDWKTVAWYMGGRTVRQCRERFKYYLAPGLGRRAWTPDEDAFLLDRYAVFGPKWAQMALLFEGRTDIDLKNRYHKLIRSVQTENEANEETQNAQDELEVQTERIKSPEPQEEYAGIMQAPGSGGRVRPRRIICASLSRKGTAAREIE